MVELAKRLDKRTEEKWQAIWDEKKYYEFDEADTKKPIYSLDTPPPFTSGDLHMGHVLSYSFFDFVARFKRMKGFNVYYPQGWDCQGFPTEVKVEKKHGRKEPQEFRELCVDWTEGCIVNMKKQMREMGFSADWKYEYRTMDPEYHKKVQLSVLKMYETGQVYRGEHPVFWCPKCHSALAKTDTDDLDRNTQLHDIKFQLETDDGQSKDLIIATTRPELMHACVAVLHHPDDERYNKLKGAKAVTALGKEVPFLPDTDVDTEFGTGVVMVCTFGDKQDVVWMYRHKLDYVKALDPYGKLLNAKEFDGLKCKDARAKILDKFKEEGKLLNSEQINQVVKVHDRCNTPIELTNSWQWFAKITEKKDDIKKAARSMKWHPDFSISHLDNWADFVEWDWVISRQRVFGTPIPFWHCEDCDELIPAEESELPINPMTTKKTCPKCNKLASGESSVFDCWVDSSITPLIISRWQDDEKFFERTYPSSLRPQGVEIIRTWAFYTIYRCKELTGKAPFEELLLNGNVLAPDGKKMSKSLGNVIAPDRLIEEYGADAVRIWAALSGAMAKDRPFSYQDMKYAKSFLHKLLNAGRFVQRSIDGYQPGDDDIKGLREIDKYYLHRLNQVIMTVDKHWANYEFHHIVKSIHDFFWHEFCDNYLEFVKFRIYDEGEPNSKKAAQYTLSKIYRTILKLLTPIIPHSTEELNQIFCNETILFDDYPQEDKNLESPDSCNSGLLLEELVTNIRQQKANNKLSLNYEIEKLILSIEDEKTVYLKNIEPELRAVCNIKDLELKTSKERSIQIIWARQKEQ